MPSPASPEEYAAFLEWRAAKDGPERPVPQDHKRKPTSAREWKKSVNTGEFDLELPSGNNCLVNRPGLQSLLSRGVLPDLLTPLAQASIDQAENAGAPTEAAQVKMNELMGAGGFATIMDAASRVTAECVVEPECRYHRRQKAAGQADQVQESYVPEWEDIPQDQRDPDILYTDEVDLEDQMFIFQFVVGGTRDLEEFRRKSG